MSGRALLIVTIVCAVAIGLAATPLGVVIGFFTGIAMAFFVAPVMFGTIYLFKLPESAGQAILNGFAVAYGVVVLLIALWGLLAWMRGDAALACGRWARAIVMAASVAVFYLSAQAVAAAF